MNSDEHKYLNRTDTLNLFVDFIKSNDNFVYAKFGDGELACMNMENGHNCDMHPYSKELGHKLIDSFINLNKLFENVYIANWEDDSYSKIRNKLCDDNKLKLNLVYYDTMLHVNGQLDEHIYKFLASIKYKKKRKIFFGPQRLNGVESFLNINTHIEVPLLNSFQYYDEYVKWLEDNVRDDDIYIFSSGMMSKVLIYDIKKINKHVTCIDMGSSFDPIFVGNTRLKQVNTNTVRSFYRNIL